jgi:MoaA/NifB/PqqE/SkfB family radical SAM enzyme
MDMLGPAVIRKIRLDLSTRCNLRCVYCAVSLPDYVGNDMPTDRALRTVNTIASLMRYNPPHPVDVNGHGETTFMREWVTICEELLIRNIPIRITTNLAKKYSPVEIDTLARMHTIGVSIDTADPDLLRRMRRKVAIDRIVKTIGDIRAAAERQRIRMPEFNFGCGLFDRTSLGVEDFARFAIDLKVRSVYFWNLWVHNVDFPSVRPADRPMPLASLSNAELRPRIEAIRRAIGLLEAAQIGVEVGGDFINLLAKRVDL